MPFGACCATGRSSTSPRSASCARTARSVHAIVSVSLTADGHDRPQGYIWQLVDVTEQRRAEAERAARAEAEAVATTIGKLQQVTEAALEHLELRDLLDVLVERLREVFAADIVRILLQDRRG